MSKLAPPHLQCAVPNCTNYTVHNTGFCQRHVRVCKCGTRMSLKAQQCKPCWIKNRMTDEQRAARAANRQDGPSSQSRAGQVKWLLGHYIRLYKSGRDQQFAESRIRALEKQL